MDVSAATAPRVLLAGATGLVGAICLRDWLASASAGGRWLVPTRRDPGIVDPRVSVLVSSLSDAGGDATLGARLRAALGDEPLDAYVSCLGTTLRTAGSREAFVAVDRDLVLRLAQLALECGARQALLVSSAGASRQSGNFYLRVKGETEDALAAMGFARIDILRPGLLLGPRAERRPAEALAQHLAPAFNIALRGKLAGYRAIPAQAVATAIRRLTGAPSPGRFVHASDAIERLAR